MKTVELILLTLGGGAGLAGAANSLFRNTPAWAGVLLGVGLLLSSVAVILMLTVAQ